MTSVQRLRELIGADEPLILPYGVGAFDAVMAERAGFEAIALSGGWASVYVLGRPDYSVISLAESVMLARNMALAVDIPVIADAEQGFGNAVNTFYAVKSLIHAGVAGLHIEDQPLPKRCGFVDGKELVSTEEMVGKLRAARDAATEMGADLVIIARTDALTAVNGGVDETIERAQRYSDEGGADVIYVEAPASVDEIRAIRDAFSGPMYSSLNAIVPHPSVNELRDLGQCIIPITELIVGPAMVAAWDLLHAFQRDGMSAWNDYQAKVSEHPVAQLRAFDLVGMPEAAEMERRYLPAEALQKYELSTGIYSVGRSAR